MTTLPEELLLLSLDELGQPRNPRSALGPALAGAVLADLLISGHLALAPDGTVAVTRTGSAGDPVLDKAIQDIGAEDKPRKLKWWVTKLAGGPWRNDVVRVEVIDDLTADGVLTKGSLKVLGLFERATHLPADPSAPERIRASVRDVLLGASGQPDERLAALIGLVDVAGLVDVCVSRSDRKQARRRAKQIAAGEETSEAVRKVQEEVMAGVLAAVTATTAATAAGNGGGS